MYSLDISDLFCIEIKDYEESIVATYQAISELPQPNRDTLAFLILHLQRCDEFHYYIHTLCTIICSKFDLVYSVGCQKVQNARCQLLIWLKYLVPQLLGIQN